jgi:hypothetical protein
MAEAAANGTMPQFQHFESVPCQAIGRFALSSETVISDA